MKTTQNLNKLGSTSHKHSSLNTNRLLMLVLSTFFIFYGTSSYGKIQANWGKIYDVRYNALIDNSINIPGAGDNITDYFMNSTNGFVKYINQQINLYSNETNFTIVFPLRDYLLDNKIVFDLQATVNHTPYTINFIGYDDVSTPQIINIDVNKIPRTYVNLSLAGPSDANYLTYGTPPSGGTIYQFPTFKINTPYLSNALTNHEMLSIYTKSTANPRHNINVMGLKFEGDNPVFTTKSTTPYYEHTYFENNLGYTGLLMNNFNDYNIDNNIFTTIYGDALYAGNNDWGHPNLQNTRSNLKGLFEDNVILNCWGRNEADNYGIGIC